MMAAETAMPRLIDRLPTVRGRMVADAPLHRFAWFRVGGPADVLFEPADRDDLCAMLRALPADVPVTVVGAASNLLIRDGGVRGLVVRLGRPFAGIKVDGDLVTAGAAAMDIAVARRAAEAGLTGLEFLSGIPGSVGGAIRMNAGAYGQEIKDALIDAVAVDHTGACQHARTARLKFDYRHCGAPADWIFLSGTFRGRPGDAAAIQARMAEIKDSREDSQPVRARTGGSTFKNPPGAKAWELIDAAGCRGLTRGGAQVSEHHCNFLVNTGEATAADLEGLGEEVRRRVEEKSGIVLEWEIRRIGEALQTGPREDAS